MSIVKKFISPQEFFEKSAQLGQQVVKSGFRPTFILGVWRGGSVPAITVDEVLRSSGFHSDDIAIRTSRYIDIGTATKGEIKVHSLDYLRNTLMAGDSILIVDDVFDSGNSLKAIKDAISNLKCGEVRIATVYYKPQCNKQNFEPDYYVSETDQWLVFPHEFEGLTEQEIKEHKNWFI